MSDLFSTLHTSRLELVEIKQEHLYDIFKLYSDPRVTRFYNIATLGDESGAQKIIDWFQSRFVDRLGIRWGISLRTQIVSLVPSDSTIMQNDIGPI